MAGRAKKTGTSEKNERKREEESKWKMEKKKRNEGSEEVKGTTLTTVYKQWLRKTTATTKPFSSVGSRLPSFLFACRVVILT